MAQEKKDEHISFKPAKDDILPPLQKRIVLHLAKSSPQTVNETVKAINGSYKSSWIAFNSLKEKKAIKEIDVKSYRGRDYPRFWLTPEGALIALFGGANLKILLEKSLTIYPDNKDLLCTLELSPIVGTEALQIAFVALLTKGRFDQSDIIKVMTAEAQELDPAKDEDFLSILKNHPKQYEKVKECARQMREKLDKLDYLLK
jgi:hypothetical protein